MPEVFMIYLELAVVGSKQNSIEPSSGRCLAPPESNAASVLLLQNPI